MKFTALMKFVIFMAFLIFFIMFLLVFFSAVNCYGEEWKITAYCPCSVCCGKWSDGYMASGVKVKEGYVACNILPFGTKVKIEDIGVFEVQDRGSRKYFDNQKHIDIYFDSHEEAKEFGVKHREVERL